MLMGLATDFWYSSMRPPPHSPISISDRKTEAQTKKPLQKRVAFL
jgi:hypothetical protein